MKYSLTLKVLLVVAIPLACQLAFLAFMSQKLKTLIAAQTAEQHFVKVMMARGQLFIDELQTPLLFELFIITRNGTCQQRISEIGIDKARVFNELAELWKDSPNRLTTLNLSWSNNVDSDNLYRSLMAQLGPRQTVSDLLGPFQNSTMMHTLLRGLLSQRDPRVNQLLPLFSADENSKREEAAAIAKNEMEIYCALFLGLAATVIASIGSGLWFSTSISRRLKVVLANIAALADSRSELGIVKGNDEISNLNSSVVMTANRIRDAKEFQAQTIAIIAEELNTPLREVDAAFIDLAKHGFETISAKGAQRLEGAHIEIRRLESLVSELVNLDIVGRSLAIVEVDLAEITNDCLKILEPIAKSKAITFVQHVPEVAIAFADSDKTMQVLINLLSNAIKYSSENSIVEVAVKVTENEVRVSVVDHGQGIPEEFHKRIFQRFEQAESGKSIKPASSGLGLAITKEIIESQGGQMGFISKVGEGSTFWFALPRTKSVEADAEHQFDHSRLHPRGWKPTLWKKAILVTALPLAVQATTVAALWNFLHINSQEISQFEKIPKITSIQAELMHGITRVSCLAMLFNVTRDGRLLEEVKSDRKNLLAKISELETVTPTEKGADKPTTELAKATKESIAFADHLMSAEKNPNISSWYGPKGPNKAEVLFTDTQKPLQAAIAQEYKLMASTDLALQKFKDDFERSLFLSALMTFVIEVVLGLFIVRSLTRRAQEIETAAIRFSNQRELSEPSPGSDELAFVERRLYESGKKLMELEVQRAEMIGITSHELRTPLTSLMALTELVESGVFGETTEEGKQILTKARLKISELIVLITNLLDLEKMESGKILVTKQPINIENVLEGVEADTAKLAQDKGINLTINMCKIELNADSQRISQSLIAVIRSIVERVPTHSDVLLEAKKMKDALIITIGAPHRVAVKGFRNKDRGFARENMAISLARQTARQHGGDLNVTTFNKGRTITISLPCS